MADVVKCSICLEPMTLVCDISATPCAHLFHTICIQHKYRETGRFVCYQCESQLSHSEFQCGKNIELKDIAKIFFKTVDEINTFAERMKKIDSDTWIHAVERLDQSEHIHISNHSIISFWKMRDANKSIKTRFEQLAEFQSKINLKRGWKSHAQVGPIQAGLSHAQACQPQEVRDNFECIDFKENGKIVEEKMQGMMSYAHAGHTQADHAHGGKGHTQADQAQAGHAKAGHTQEGYAQAVHDNFESNDSKENCKPLEEKMLGMKISDDVSKSKIGAKHEVGSPTKNALKLYEKNPDQIIVRYGKSYVNLPNNQGYKLVTQSEGIRRVKKSDVANLDDFLDEPRAAEPLEEESYAHVGHTLLDHAHAGHAQAGLGQSPAYHAHAGPGHTKLDKANLDDFLDEPTLTRENLHAVDISRTTNLTPLVNVVFERPQISSLNSGIDKMTYEKALKKFEKR